MKDKTLYWILGIIGAYFAVRFIMNHTGSVTNKQTAKNNAVSEPYTDEQGRYHYNGHVEGEEAGVCRECGSKTYFRRGFSPSGPGHVYILRPVCSNSKCPTQYILY